MKIIISEKQSLLIIKKLLLEGVNPEEYVKAFLEVLGISIAKNSGEISEALGKNPITVTVKNADGSVESFICKNLDELIVVSQKLAKSELDFTSGIRSIVKQNPNLKVDFGSSLYKGDIDATIKKYVKLRDKFSKQTTTPTPITNDLPKQKIAESDVEQILRTRVTQITDTLNEFMFKTTTPDSEVTLPKGFEFDVITNPTKALEDLEKKLETLYGLQNANDGYITNLRQIFSKWGGVYDSDSVDFGEINKLIDEYKVSSEDLYNQTILDLTKVYNDLDGMKLHVEEETVPDKGFTKDDFLDATLRGDETVKQVDNATEKFGTNIKTFRTKLNQKYGTSLKNKITQAIQENANTKTVDVRECFEGNPLIYNPNKKGEPGWTEDGLKQEFVDLLNEQSPNFLQKLKNGEYKYVIDENGNWDQINMLNTNNGDRAQLFDDFVTSEGKKPIELTNQEAEDLMNKFLNLENSELKKLIEKNKTRYTKNSVKNSAEGDRIEDNFDKKFEPGGELESLGQIVFKPKGRGNPLDFQGYDRIILNKNGEYIPLQIKKSGVIKQGQSVVFPGQENLNFYMFSGVRIKKGYVCVEDPEGNWIVYPPQTQFDTQVISKANKETGTPGVFSYTLKTKDGKPVKDFRRIGGKTYVDISSEPGDEFYTNIDFSKQ